jgi:CNT family concentrative nucleoside transporter
MLQATSALGLFGMIALAWLLSANKRRFNLRVVVGGILLQFLFAFVVLRTEPGRIVFEFIRDVFLALVGCASAGSRFVFGSSLMSQDFMLASFAFQALPTIIFFSALMSVLYYFGVMQAVIRAMAVVMQKTLRTSGAETLSTAANVFVGQTEAPLVIRPYLAQMTNSELMAVMVAGFATVAGGVMAAYVGMGVDPVHLLTASVISAPAALLIAKVMQPEVDQPLTLGHFRMDARSEAVNVIHAAAIGAADGLKLALNVAAMIIAFLGLLYMVDQGIAWLGALFGQTWSLQAALGYAFAPIAWMMGVEPDDCLNVGRLLGVKMVANEFLAYDQLVHMRAQELPCLGALTSVPPELLPKVSAISERSDVIATYALCGFANFGSIGVQLGGIGPLAPERRADLARLGFRAMLGGTLAACMTACIAGVML